MSAAYRFAVVLLLLAPAAHAAVIRIIERNGASTTTREVVSVRIKRGTVEVVPDTIFTARFER